LAAVIAELGLIYLGSSTHSCQNFNLLHSEFISKSLLRKIFFLASEPDGFSLAFAQDSAINASVFASSNRLLSVASSFANNSNSPLI